jgi:putative protease
MHYPEIVAPGWSYTKAIVAAQYGADAVYLGVPYTSLRMRQNKIKDFAMVKKTIDDLHALGTKAYLTMNIFPRNMDIHIFEMVVEQISTLGADAIIFSDPGTFTIIKKYLPKIKLHLSTQTNTLNYEAVQFWYDLWVERIVLARELTLKEIIQIKEKVPWVELEVFVHGAMCIAYSGRCLLGEYFSGRDGNKWECSHVCRYKFKTEHNQEDALLYTGSVIEEKRTDKHFAVAQDNEWSYIFSSKDLCTIDRLAEIMPYVHGLKIEWRSKWEFYVWTVAKAYKYMRDTIINNTQIDQNIISTVYQIPHRPYRSGFLFSDIRSAPDWEPISWVTQESAGPVVQREYYGLILPETKTIIHQWKELLCHRLVIKQHMQSWIELEYMTPSKQGSLKLLHFFDERWVEQEDVKTVKEDIYVCTDRDLSWREVIYGPVRNY